MLKFMRPILLLEINEVPIRVWKKYAADPRYPSIGRFLNESTLVETEISDEGELSPWCTWPTFHRGLSKQEHGVYNLGQDPSTFQGTTIWEEFRKKGMPVGVFGSMQSWPPVDPGPGGFYVPDTFSADARCIPSYLEPVQAFNLLQVRNNARVMANQPLRRPPALSLIFGMLRSGVRLSTLASIAIQLVAERLRPLMRERRVAYQALLFWDIFRAHFHPGKPPAFTTFFTNHIASVMHRYWSHIFPEDFPEQARPEGREHLATMEFAMKVLDGILSEVLDWRERNPDLLVLAANSMGQRAILREKHEGFELLIQRPQELLLAIKPGWKAKQNLAMMPQVSLEFDRAEDASDVAALINAARLPSGKGFLNGDARGTSLTIGCHTPAASELEKGYFMSQGREIPFHEAGLEKVKVDAGTAYHEKEGLILANGLEKSEGAPVKVDATAAKSLILRWAGLERV